MLRIKMGRAAALIMCIMLCLALVISPASSGLAAGEVSRAGTYRALLVACTDNRLGQGPYNDLMIMRLALINMGVPSQNITVISNNMSNYDQHHPTESYDQLKKADVQGWIKSAFAGATAADTNIFFYSGHGNNNNNGTSYNGTNIVLNDYYPTDELASDLAAIPGRHLVMLDCCNSGGLIAKSAVYDEQLQQDMAEDIEAGMELQSKSAAHNPNFFVITAASAREESLGSTLGMLTSSLAGGMGVNYKRGSSDGMNTPYYASGATINSAMADQNRDRNITLNELFDHAFRDATGSIPTVYPQDSDEVLFSYTSVDPAHVTNMQISGPTADNKISGTFDYYGPGTPSTYIVGYSLVIRGNSLLTFSSPRTTSLYSMGGTKYSFTCDGLDYVRDRVMQPQAGDSVVTYCFNVEVRNSTSTSALYREPFTLSGNVNTAPTILFRDTSPQPERIQSGGQEYRLQISFNYDCYIDLYIMDAHGNKVRTLAENSPSRMKYPNTYNPSREMDFYWDGRDDSGNFVGGDGYTARAVARNSAGTSATIVESRLAGVKVGSTPTSISMQQSYSVGTGGSTIIKLTGTPSDAYTGATWTSSDPSIAAVDNGKVTGRSSGQVTITATSKENPSLTAQTQVVVFKAGWQQDSSGTFYIKPDGNRADGWYKVGDTWYYFANTIMKTDWLKNGSWYYLKADGAMATGWVKVGSNWYYMKASGAMTTGWQKVNNVWYYMKPSGAMATGWVKDKGKWYYLKASGAMAVGWEKVGGNWYYLESSGAMATGWKKVNGNWYYLYASGAMAANTTIDGKYRLGASGAML